jgi:hypothetical protein
MKNSWVARKDSLYILLINCNGMQEIKQKKRRSSKKRKNKKNRNNDDAMKKNKTEDSGYENEKDH